MSKHREMAMAWMAENPQAYLTFDRYASQLAKTGRPFGAKLISERIRYECYLRKIGDFKWNNNYTKYVAELWAENNPRFAHLITTRAKKESK